VGAAEPGGVGSRLWQHSLQAARRLGFRLRQFNLVVSTNAAGLRCWQRNGFLVVGTPCRGPFTTGSWVMSMPW